MMMMHELDVTYTDTFSPGPSRFLLTLDGCRSSGNTAGKQREHSGKTAGKQRENSGNGTPGGSTGGRYDPSVGRADPPFWTVRESGENARLTHSETGTHTRAYDHTHHVATERH